MNILQTQTLITWDYPHFLLHSTGSSLFTETAASPIVTGGEDREGSVVRVMGYRHYSLSTPVVSSSDICTGASLDWRVLIFHCVGQTRLSSLTAVPSSAGRGAGRAS